jgi:hypothetical protein
MPLAIARDDDEWPKRPEREQELDVGNHVSKSSLGNSAPDLRNSTQYRFRSRKNAHRHSTINSSSRSSKERVFRSCELRGSAQAFPVLKSASPPTACGDKSKRVSP